MDNYEEFLISLCPILIHGVKAAQNNIKIKAVFFLISKQRNSWVPREISRLYGWTEIIARIINAKKSIVGWGGIKP